ncbi:MAG: hypothetical protein PHO28_04680 [Candidatus Pacebacteria bacterium]|nr:hypothetical protein [Candidatus Paceibacterota bacterium]
MEKYILNDQLYFWLFEILISIIFIKALYKDKVRKDKKQNPQLKVSVLRGEKSQKILVSSASAFVTIILSTIFIISSYPKEEKVIFYLINLAMIFYLFFYSGWFTNKVIIWWTSFGRRQL